MFYKLVYFCAGKDFFLTLAATGEQAGLLLNMNFRKHGCHATGFLDCG